MFYYGKISSEKPLKISSKDLKIYYITTIKLNSNTISSEKVNVNLFKNENKEKYKIYFIQKNKNEIYNCNIILSTNKKKEYTFKIDCVDKQEINIFGFIEYEENNEEKKINEEKIENKKLVEEKNENKKEKKSDYGDLRNIPDIEDDILDDNSELEIEKLLNKKRKEAPQDVKPIVLKNIKDDKNTFTFNKNKKKEKNQENNKFKDNKNQGNKKFKHKDFDNKNKNLQQHFKKK